MTSHAAQPNGTPEFQAIAGELNTETKFMHQYRVGAAAHSKGKILAVRNKSNQIEIFTAGTDGTVWNYYPDSSNPAGYNRVKTGLVLNFDFGVLGSWDVGVDSRGNVFVFAAINHGVEYAVKVAGKVATWETFKTNLVADGHERFVYAQNIGGTLYVGVLALFNLAPVTFKFDYAKVDSAWEPGIFNFHPTTLTTGPPFGVWMSPSADVVEFVSFDENVPHTWVRRCNVSNHDAFTKDKFVFGKGGAPYFMASANNQCFAHIFKDPNIYQLWKTEDNSYTWKSITKDAETKNLNMYQLAAETDAAGTTYVFALGYDTYVHYTASKPDGGWEDLATIPKGGWHQMAVAKNDSGNVELFLIGGKQDVITRMIRNSATGAWESYPIELPSRGPEHVEEFISYSTDITVRDAVGAPMPNAKVKLRASSQTQVIVDGQPLFINAHTPASVETNPMGMLTVTQLTDTLGVAALQVEVVGASQDSKPFAVRQFEGVRDDLKKLKTEQLQNAKDKKGALLLPQALINKPKEVDQIRQAINQCMALPPQHSLDATGLSREARKLGVGWCADGVTEHLNRLSDPDIQTRWQLDFSGEEIVYRELTAEAAQSLLADMRANATDAATFFRGIYDFVVGVYNGIYEVASLIYEGGKATFNFIWGGVKYVFSLVVEFFEQAFGLVESIFAAIKVSFERLFEWLGFVFNWDDILRTRTALSYWILEYLKFLEGAAGGIQAMFDDGIATMKVGVHNAFKELIDAVGAKSPGAYVKDNVPHKPELSSAAANNFLMNALAGNAGSASTSSPAFEYTGGSVGDFNGILTKLQELGRNVKDHPEFAAAQAYMSNLGKDPAEVFTQVLSALLLLLEGLIKLALDGVQAIIDLIMQSVASLMAALRNLLEAKWNIPFVTDFYCWLTKADGMTMLDMLALTIAIPSTPLYKILKGKAPFPDQASIDAFKSSYNSRMLLSMSGFGPRLPEALTVNGAEGNVFDIFSCIGSMSFMFATVLLDVQNFTGTGSPSSFTKTMSKVALGFKLGAKACSFPLFLNPTGVSCNDKGRAIWTLYGYECFGLLLDTIFVVVPAFSETMPENNDTWFGPLITTVYGAAHAGMVGLIAWPHLNTSGKISKVFILIPECTKLVRIVPVPAAKVVIGFIDGICITGSAIAGAVANFTSQFEATPAGILYPLGAVRLAE